MAGRLRRGVRHGASTSGQAGQSPYGPDFPAPPDRIPRNGGQLPLRGQISRPSETGICRLSPDGAVPVHKAHLVSPAPAPTLHLPSTAEGLRPFRYGYLPEDPSAG